MAAVTSSNDSANVVTTPCIPLCAPMLAEAVAMAVVVVMVLTAGGIGAVAVAVAVID